MVGGLDHQLLGQEGELFQGSIGFQVFYIFANFLQQHAVKAHVQQALQALELFQCRIVTIHNELVQARKGFSDLGRCTGGCRAGAGGRLHIL